MSDADPCACHKCHGLQNPTDPSGTGAAGFQCNPLEQFEGQRCKQDGEDSRKWVIQTAREVQLDRFCRMACKPLLVAKISKSVSCAALTREEIRMIGQSPDGNGQAYSWHINPMTDSLTVSDFQAAPSLGDPISNMKQAFAQVAEGAASGAAAGDTVPSNCNCNCGPGIVPPAPPPMTPPPPRRARVAV